MALHVSHTFMRKGGVSASLSARALATAVAVALALGLCTPLDAHAEVRKSDLVMGTSVEERGLTVAQCPSIDALYAYVVDDRGTVYFERDATAPTQIASLTKIMTAVVALDAVAANTVSLDDELTVSERAAEVGESSAGLQEGDKLTLETALYALMVPSGNDAAIAIAEYVGGRMVEADGGQGDAQQAFVDAMNAKCTELGCVDSVYRNPHGLDNGEFAGDQHSCAADQARIVQYAMQNELFRTIVGGGSTTIEVQRADTPEDGGDTEYVDTEIALESTDLLLDMYDNACGVKTGFTELAGNSFAGAANDGSRYVYAIVIHSSSEYQRFTDAQTLFEWVYGNIVDYSLANSSLTESFATPDGEVQAPVVAQVTHADWVDVTIPAVLSDPDATAEVFSLNGNVSQSFEFNEVHGNVHEGDVIGKATFKQHNQVVAEYDLVAAADVEAPNFFENIGVWWDKLFRGFNGQPQVADSVVLNTTPLINDKASAL